MSNRDDLSGARGLIRRAAIRRRATLRRVGLGAALLASCIGGAVNSARAASPQPHETISAEELAAVRAAEKARIDAIDKVYGAVVAIYGNDRGGGGSGVLFDPAGYALTNYHVVAGAGTEGWAGLADTKLYRWKLIGMDPGGDIAIIKLTGKDSFPTAPLGNSDSVRVGDFAMAMGNPFILAEDQRPTVTLGIVSGIKRYQPGEGGATMLVYGNCIQVDSSINPGNSGGPLFNLRSEVIGINGRGSFKERGRVNVGVGYAISVEQIKNFVPELLATKTALHGTLEATFSDRGGRVICDRLNLNAKIAELGLALGDRLVAFDGEPIENANQYTNNVSTIPAGWPVEVAFEHDGRVKKVWLRLPDLPYPAQKSPPPQNPPGDKKPKGSGKDPSKSPAPRAPDPDHKPGDKQPKNPSIPVAQRPQPPKMEPGKITDLKANQEEYARVLAAWTSFVGGRAAIDSAHGIQMKDEILRDGKPAGEHQLLLAADGRFRVSYTLDGTPHSAGFDGKDYWTQVGAAPGPANTVSPVELTSDPLFASALAMARLMKEGGLNAGAAHYELQGSDRAARQRAYRLRTSLTKNDAKTDDLFTWFSLLDEAGGAMQVRLLKTATGADGTEIYPAVVYQDYREVAGLRLPHCRRLVDGLGEVETLRLVSTGYQASSENSESAFKPTANRPE